MAAAEAADVIGRGEQVVHGRRLPARSAALADVVAEVEVVERERYAGRELVAVDARVLKPLDVEHEHTGQR